jgi:azurin
MSESPIKTPKQLILVIVAAFIIPIAIIVLLTKYVSYSQNSTVNSNAYTDEAISSRISPIGEISNKPPPMLIMVTDSASVESNQLASLEEPEDNKDPCFINISAADNMMFNKKKLTFDSKCTDLTLSFKHKGKMPANAGGHNVVIIETDNFEKVTSKIDMKLGEKSGYLPDIPEVIAKTGIIGGGEEAQFKLDVSKLSKVGKYTFLCSFPGHYALMRGEIQII